MSHREVLDAVQKGTNVILGDNSNSEREFLHHWINTLELDLISKSVPRGLN
jgi:hypothetical protein